MSLLKGAGVLVTGGAGFIGSHLVDRLLEHAGAGHVRVLDNMVNADPANCERWAGDPRFELRVGDIRDRADVAGALEGIQVVFHLACLGVRHSLHSPQENHEVNAGGTLTLLEGARLGGVRRFISVSSSEVFGSAQFAPMDELHPTWPETVYGGSKLAGEAYARAFFRTYGFPSLVARPFNTYGPRSHFGGDSGEVIPRTIVRLLNDQSPVVFGDGTQTRDFMHVYDTARGLVALAECGAAVGRTVNLGSGVEISMNHLCRVVARAVGASGIRPEHLPARPGDVSRLLVDATLMEALTGFRPAVPFESGIAELVQWFRSLPQSPEEMAGQVAEQNWTGAAPDGGVPPGMTAPEAVR